MVVSSANSKLEQTIKTHNLSREHEMKQLQSWDKGKHYTYVLVDTKAVPENNEGDDEENENFIRFVKGIFYVGRGTIKEAGNKGPTPKSQRAFDHVREADKNNLSDVSIIMR